MRDDTFRSSHVNFRFSARVRGYYHPDWMNPTHESHDDPDAYRDFEVGELIFGPVRSMNIDRVPNEMNDPINLSEPDVYYLHTDSGRPVFFSVVPALDTEIHVPVVNPNVGPDVIDLA